MEQQAGSMGIQIQRIVDVLETQGEMEWATKIDDAYYSHIGTDAVRAALVKLRDLQKDDMLLDRLEIREKVRSVIAVLSLAAGDGELPPEPSASPVVTHQLYDALTGKDDEEVHSLGAASEGARRLLETLKDQGGEG